MRKTLSLLIAFILAFSVMAGAILMYPESAAGATTLTVNNNSDSGDDATIGVDLAADTADGAGLSLREALNWATAGDNVTFDAALSGSTVVLSGTRLTIDKDIILDGDLNNDGVPDVSISGNGSSQVIYTTGLSAAARLEGLIIQSGNATASEGGGMYNKDSSPVITNCIFSGNTAQVGGGMVNDHSSPVITNCGFSGNTAFTGGGMANSNSSPTITDCTFSGNVADSGSVTVFDMGGGMVNYESSPVISNCTFSGNAADLGGGMVNYENSSPVIANCALSGNTAYFGGGGMVNINSSPVIANCILSGNTADWVDSFGGGMANGMSSSNITNCIFSGNAANRGGGMSNEVSSVVIASCTFYGNTANTSGKAIFEDSSPAITNCILWGDTGSGGEIDGTATANVSYSNMQGGYSGTGNIDADPKFVNASGGDLHIKSKGGHWTTGGWVLDSVTSPCLDAGDPASPYSNEPAPNGGRINMGAYGNTTQASRTPAPEINLKQGTTAIADGGSYNFGNKSLNTHTDIAFTIENQGTANLTLTSLPLTIGGTDAGQFSIQAQPSSPVAASGNTSFTVRFSPTSSGSKTATIAVANNDIDENPYDLTITGTVAAPPATSPTDGGGGEDYTYSNIDILGTIQRLITSSTGRVYQSVKATSPDGRLTVNLAKGTEIKDKKGRGLHTLNVAVNNNPPPPPGYNQIIGLTYDFQPDGATFKPPITLILTYDPVNLPVGVAEKNLVLSWYDENSKTWIKLESMVDTKSHTITGEVSHFTSFTIIGEVTPLPASFSTSNLLIQPEAANPDEAVTIKVTITNSGGMEGICSLMLKINGMNEETKDVTVAAGVCESVSFILRRQQPGIYIVNIGGLTGVFKVIAPVPTSISKSATITPQPKAEVNPPLPPLLPTSLITPSPAPTSVQALAPTPPRTAPTTNWPLILGIAGGVIVAGLLIFLLIRTIIWRRGGM